MNAGFEVDLDSEKILVDGHWYDRAGLAGLLSERLASMDYNIARLSAAVEHLDTTIKLSETFSVRLTPEVAAQLRQTAERNQMPPAAVIREAVVSYLVGAALSKLG